MRMTDVYFIVFFPVDRLYMFFLYLLVFDIQGDGICCVEFNKPVILSILYYIFKHQVGSDKEHHVIYDEQSDLG